MTTDTPLNEELTFCAVHPDRETSLRCNRCGRLMCVQCAVLTPVGYRCRECVRQQEDKFFTASQPDYLIIAAICAGLGAVGAAIVSALNLFLILVLVAALPFGGAVGELALRAVSRRRGRYSGQVAAAAVALGGLAGAVAQVYVAFSQIAGRAGRPAALPLEAALGAALSDLGLLLFVALAAAAVYSRFRMRI